MTRLTRQGVRDLNLPGHANPARRSGQAARGCPHVWETDRDRDCWTGEVFLIERCGMCHATRR